MILKYYPYSIKLKEEFRISINSRKTTPAVMVEVAHDGIIGYGESSLPPYLQEDQKSVINFLKKIDLTIFKDPTDINIILDYIDHLSGGNNAAKASIDIALHDLFGKIENVPLYKYLNINKKEDIYTSFTIGISEEESLKHKIADASQYKILKVKLGTENDKKIIEQVRFLSDKPLFVDINQGWNDKHFALDMINWLAEQNVVLVEQPLPKELIKESEWLNQRSSLPIIADEAVQALNDLEFIKDAYSGINIKLMKCGGIRPVHRMILKSKELNLKIMIGCMTETTCAITAASHLSSLADWVDLDGAELISNDVFSGSKIEKGRIIIPDLPGLGIEKLSESKDSAQFE
jgi:L-alanine-DL-glutamate epimerase-like enolase superfamily enzyme